MSLATVGGPSAPGMSTLMNRMGRQHASSISKNQASMDALSAFIGPSSEGAPVRINQVERLLGELTNIPEYLQVYAQKAGLDEMGTAALWKGMVESVGGTKSLKASLGNTFSTMNTGMTAAGGWAPPPSMKDRFNAKHDAMEYILSNLTNGSPEFAQQMVMNSILPIAKQMIPNTVATKAFITDPCIGELSKPYVKKSRYPAYMQGLAEEAQGIPPTAVQDYETMLVTPREWKRPVSIDMKYIETMNFDVPADILSDGGRELQVLIDQAFFKGLDTLVPNVGAVPVAGSTINGWSLDTNQSCMMLEQGRNPQVEDLNFANQLLRNRGYHPDLIITSPFELGALMSEQAVLMAYAYGTREVQETGLVGTLVGDAVAWTPNLYQGGSPSSLVIWVCDSDELARIVMGFPISLYPDFHMRRLDFLLYTRLALFFRNVNSCVKIVCSNADTGIT